MKRAFIIALLAGSVITSCKKDYICRCSSKVNGTIVNKDYAINDTKDNAEEACAAKSVTGSTGESCVIQ